VTFSASSSFIAGVTWATPRFANGPTTLIKDSFILGIKYCQRCVPADKQVPVDELYFRRIPEMLPELDHLMGIFRFEFEPQNKQHVSSPISTELPLLP